MIYRSNLTAPDLTPHFKYLHSRVMGHSFGHDVLSDWADKADDDPVFGIYKRCGFWTHDEAAILYNVAKSVEGEWCDIGAHTGWTSAHIYAATGEEVNCVDPLLRRSDVALRLEENTGFPFLWQWPIKSESLFDPLSGREMNLSGVVIDGDHEPGAPLADAQGAVAHLASGGVILFHDFVGLPVREAVRWLMLEQEMRVKLYLTPHVVACCWWNRDWEPPHHVPDPGIVAQDLPARWEEFDWRPFL